MTSHAPRVLRNDIQALRAIAVVAVLGYHLWPGVLRGGFVGVDVFFVISGFLITGNLVREAERTGRIRLREFWSRRARRLLPASLLVLFASAVAVALWAPENLRPQFLRETVASSLYVQNWLLAADSVDYLAADNTPSPVQHFWTLSAEEQFYVFTPLVLVAILLASRVIGSRRRLMLGAIAALTVASFAYSVWLTWSSPPTAYFVTTTRAWEFGIGALLVFAPRATSQFAGRAAVAGGVLAIAVAAVMFSGDVPFPGVAAAWPVLATAGVIWGGPAMGRRWEGVAGFRPAQFVGRISYSMYLWHWPLIVILPYVLDRPLHGLDRVGVAVATIVLAWLSTVCVEDPIRNSTRLLGGNRSPRAIAAWALVGMTVVVGTSGCSLLVTEIKRGESARATAEVEASAPNCLGAMAIVAGGPCAVVLPPTVLVPDPGQASTDTWNRPECWARVDEAALRICTLGPANATVRLAAIGDSHNNVLLAAYEGLAQRQGWRIDVAGHNGCYWTTAVQQKPVQAMVEGCEAWKANLNEYLAGAQPYDAILVTHARTGHLPIVEAGRDVDAATADGLVEAWATQVARGTRIIAIRDNPRMAADVVECVVRYREAAASRCAVSAGEGLGRRDPLVEAVERVDEARLVDLTDIYCPDDVCVPIVGNVVVYQDRDHMTATFVRSLTSVLATRVAAALR